MAHVRIVLFCFLCGGVGSNIDALCWQSVIYVVLCVLLFVVVVLLVLTLQDRSVPDVYVPWCQSKEARPYSFFDWPDKVRVLSVE
jgi:hypothetical protein